MNGVIVVLIVIVALALAIGLWGIATYNGFIRMRNSVEEGFSTMDVYLKKRYDLIPNLVETVKGYAAHESGTLEKVIQARNMAQSARGIEERMAGENQLTGTLKSLFALAESYPDLKANASFMDMQQQLRRIEEEIANARKFYNAVVKEFNTKVESVPSNMVAGLFKFAKKPMFEVDDQAERQNVRVQF